MPLIPCPACGREISTEAEACPQCGHPNRRAAPPAPSTSATPKCYSCAEPATTRCQSCGAMSCAQHLESIYVYHGQSGGYELRCQTCYSGAMLWKMVTWAIVGIVLIAVLFGIVLSNR